MKKKVDNILYTFLSQKTKRSLYIPALKIKPIFLCFFLKISQIFFN